MASWIWKRCELTPQSSGEQSPSPPLRPQHRPCRPAPSPPAPQHRAGNAAGSGAGAHLFRSSSRGGSPVQASLHIQPSRPSQSSRPGWLQALSQLPTQGPHTLSARTRPARQRRRWPRALSQRARLPRRQGRMGRPHGHSRLPRRPGRQSARNQPLRWGQGRPRTRSQLTRRWGWPVPSHSLVRRSTLTQTLHTWGGLSSPCQRGSARGQGSRLGVGQLRRMGRQRLSAHQAHSGQAL